jgi:hypothetical protein
MYLKSKLLIICILFFLLSGCVDEVDIVVKGKEEIVVNCVLTYKDHQELQVVYSKSLGGGLFYEPIVDAVAELWEDEELVGTFAHQGLGRWNLEFTPKPFMVYHLKVKVPGRKEITATTTMPENPSINFEGLSNHCLRFSQLSQPFPVWAFSITNGGETEEWLDPFSELSVGPSDRMYDDIATNHPFVDKFNATSFLLVDLGDMATHPGFFYYLRILPHDTPLEFEIETMGIYYQFIVFRSCSHEYDNYLKSVMLKVLSHESNEDVFYGFDEDQTYSNIDNGVGIFGAYEERVFPIRPPTFIP